MTYLNVDQETGELLPATVMVKVERPPAIVIDIDDVRKYHHTPETLIDKIRSQAAYAVFDVGTEKGRAACRSHAANIIKCISPALNASKAMAVEAQKIVKQDLAFRRVFETAVREIADYHRKPLTEYEQEQERIKAEQLAREEKRMADMQYELDWDDALHLDELFTLRAEKRKAEEHAAAESRAIEQQRRFDEAVAQRLAAEQQRMQQEAEARAQKIIRDEAQRLAALERQKAKEAQARVDLELRVRAEERAKADEAGRIQAESAARRQETVSKQDKPTKAEIIQLVAGHYRVDEKTAAAWLADLQSAMI
jgi:colicin import membrane protein